MVTEFYALQERRIEKLADAISRNGWKLDSHE
jgi:hypothetical protein